MVKSKKKIIVLPHGFKERFLTWQIGDISPHWASVLGIIRFGWLALLLLFSILMLILIPNKLGYYW